MLNSKFRLSFVILLLYLPIFAWALSPEGKWAARSPFLGEKPIGIVKISVLNQQLFGELIEVIPLNGSLENICKRSKRNLQVGPLMMCGYRQSGDQWTGGYIYNSSSGKIYRSRLKLSTDGNELYVTGTSALFSKTVTWTRVG